MPKSPWSPTELLLLPIRLTLVLVGIVAAFVALVVFVVAYFAVYALALTIRRIRDYPGRHERSAGT